MTRAELWSVIIQGAGVILTLLLAVIAIWGDQIRARWVGPKLRLSLYDPEGILTCFTNGPPTRYYHLKVENLRKGAIAHNVRVVISSIMKPAADGRWAQETISGPLQLQWRFHENHPQFSIIGPDDICDLGFVLEGQGFKFALYLCPNNFNPIIAANQRVRLDLLALADDAIPSPLSVEIAWDGVWSIDTPAMKKHLVIKQV